MGTFFVDIAGLQNLGLTCIGGEEELHALREGRAPPETAYRPRLANIAPRTDGWAPSRSNTQQPPRSGPNKHQKPAAHQPRADMFPLPKKVLP